MANGFDVGGSECFDYRPFGFRFQTVDEWGREKSCSPVEEGRAKPVGKPRVSEDAGWENRTPDQSLENSCYAI